MSTLTSSTEILLFYTDRTVTLLYKLIQYAHTCGFVSLLPSTSGVSELSKEKYSWLEHWKCFVRLHWWSFEHITDVPYFL